MRGTDVVRLQDIITDNLTTAIAIVNVLCYVDAESLNKRTVPDLNFLLEKMLTRVDKKIAELVLLAGGNVSEEKMCREYPEDEEE